MKPNTRLKINKFARKYGKTILVVLAIWLLIISINFAFKINNNKIKDPKTSYEPHKSVLDQQSSVPKKVQNAMEDFVEEYVKYCNNGEYEKAYEMISEDCKENNFLSFSDYSNYVRNKFGINKIYSIQNYSNYNDKYIYSIKIYDDILSTGLTNSTYSFQEEKIVASYDENNNIVFSVGNFIEKDEIFGVQENDYIKIDIRNKIVKYSLENYEVKFTNRSNKTIIVQNNQVENEILMNIKSDYRKNMTGEEIILEPGQTKTCTLIFNKFYDDGIQTQSIIFDSIRVVDEYIPENANEENAIYKFSMEVGF